METESNTSNFESMMSITISSSNLQRTELWSEPNSGKRDSGSDELSSGEFGYSSEVESGLVETEETEEVTSLRAGLTMEALFLVERLCLDDFLGNSGKMVSGGDFGR